VSDLCDVSDLCACVQVERGKPKSHAGKGWETLTDKIIQVVSAERKGVVFLLWGGHAQVKAKMINKQTHLVLTSAHPSPLSASNGFFGCRHFSQTNAYLQKNNLPPINWAVD
jgi:uracil-DNA glycosylase